jgi:ABC-type uncharacterized transport system substrate-binding protein
MCGRVLASAAKCGYRLLMKATTVFFAAIVCLGVLISWNADAHPHIWANVQTELEVDGAGRVVGFRHRWAFDKDFTESATQILDTNPDGSITADALKSFAQTNVESLKDFHYFTFPMVKGKPLDLKEPLKDYYVEYKDKQLILHFTVPLSEPVTPENLPDFSFSVYDPEFYMALSFEGDDAVKVQTGKKLHCTPKIEEPPTTAEIPLSQMGQIDNSNANAGAGSKFARKVTMQCAKVEKGAALQKVVTKHR